MAEDTLPPPSPIDDLYKTAISKIVDLFAENSVFKETISNLSQELKKSCENLVEYEYILIFNDYNFDFYKNKKQNTPTIINDLIEDLKKNGKKYFGNKQKPIENIRNRLSDQTYFLLYDVNKDIGLHMDMYQNFPYRDKNFYKGKVGGMSPQEYEKNETKINKEFNQRNNYKLNMEKEKIQIDKLFKEKTGMCILEWVNNTLSCGFTPEATIQGTNMYSNFDDLTEGILTIPLKIMYDIIFSKGNLSTLKEIIHNNYININSNNLFKFLLSDSKKYEKVEDDKFVGAVVETSKFQMNFIYMYLQYSLFFNIITKFVMLLLENNEISNVNEYIEERYILLINKIRKKISELTAFKDLFDTTPIPDVVRTGGRRRHLKTRRRTRFRKAKKLKSKSKTKTKTKKRRHTKKNKYL